MSLSGVRERAFGLSAESFSSHPPFLAGVENGREPVKAGRNGRGKGGEGRVEMAPLP